MGLRCFVWVFNTAYILFSLGIIGPLGVRALIGLSEFRPYYTCDSRTGNVIKSHHTNKTVISTFCKVLNGMWRSRENFES